MEDLVGVGVADAGDDRLRGQHRLDVARRRRQQMRQGVHVEGRVERIDAERGHRLDVVGFVHDPQGQALLGPHLGDVESRPAVEPDAQRQRPAARPGLVGGELVVALDPAPPGQMDHEPRRRRGPCTGTSPAGVHPCTAEPTSDDRGGSKVFSAAMAPSSQRSIRRPAVRSVRKRVRASTSGNSGTPSILPRPGVDPARRRKRSCHSEDVSSREGRATVRRGHTTRSPSRARRSRAAAWRRPRARGRGAGPRVVWGGSAAPGRAPAGQARARRRRPRPPPPRAPTTTTTVAEPPVTPVQWTPCGALQCGTVAVPLDYAHPQSGSIAIAVARHRATDPAAAHRLPGDQPRRPRGVGGERPPRRAARAHTAAAGPLRHRVVRPPRCRAQRPRARAARSGSSASSSSVTLPDPVPSTPAAQLALIANDKAFAAQCQARERSAARPSWAPSTPPATSTASARPSETPRSPSSGIPTARCSAPPTPRCSRPTCGPWSSTGPSTPPCPPSRWWSNRARASRQCSTTSSRGARRRAARGVRPGDPADALLALIGQSRAHRACPPGRGRRRARASSTTPCSTALYARSSWPTLGGGPGPGGGGQRRPAGGDGGQLSDAGVDQRRRRRDVHRLPRPPVAQRLVELPRLRPRSRGQGAGVRPAARLG